MRMPNEGRRKKEEGRGKKEEGRGIYLDKVIEAVDRKVLSLIAALEAESDLGVLTTGVGKASTSYVCYHRRHRTQPPVMTLKCKLIYTNPAASV